MSTFEVLGALLWLAGACILARMFSEVCVVAAHNEYLATGKGPR